MFLENINIRMATNVHTHVYIRLPAAQMLMVRETLGVSPAPMPCGRCGTWIQQPWWRYAWQGTTESGYWVTGFVICRVCSLLSEILAAQAHATESRDRGALERLGDLLEIVVHQLRTEVVPPTPPESQR